jgi:putative transposase
MSRFRKLTHLIWQCQYHIVWTPKLSISKLMGIVKGRTAIRISKQFA